MKLLKGLETLKRHILHEASHTFRSAPILLVTNARSEADTAAQRSDHPHRRPVGSGNTHHCSKVSHACRRVQSLLQQQLGLPCLTVEACPAHQKYGGGPYPTLDRVRQVRDLASRTSAGKSVVVGVGTGASLDLAKALVTVDRGSKKDAPSLVLVPATFPAVMVSASSHALLLDPDEATLVATATGDNASNRTVVQLDVKQMSLHNLSTSILAAVAVLLDRLRLGNRPNDQVLLLLDVLIQARSLLTNESPPLLPSEELWDAFRSVGHETILQYGTHPALSVRSLPLAIAASLAPTTEHHSVMALMAGTVQWLADQHVVVNNDNASSSILSQMKDPNFWSVGGGGASSSSDEQQQQQQMTFPNDTSVEDLLSHIRANRSLHKSPCRDDETALRQILSHLLTLS